MYLLCNLILNSYVIITRILTIMLHHKLRKNGYGSKMNGNELIEYSLCCVNLVIITMVLGLVFSFIFSLLGDLRDILRKN